MTGAPTVRVIDADTHLTEPADLRTARIPARFLLVRPRRQLQHDRLARVSFFVPPGLGGSPPGRAVLPFSRGYQSRIFLDLAHK